MLGDNCRKGKETGSQRLQQRIGGIISTDRMSTSFSAFEEASVERSHTAVSQVIRQVKNEA